MSYGKSVAIVGVGGEFPDAQHLKDYWQAIISNRSSAATPPDGRWLLPPEEIYREQKGAPDSIYSVKGCFLPDHFDTQPIEGLDIDPALLRRLDPMYRLLLRVGRQTVSSIPQRKVDPARAGVIIGNLALPTEASSAISRQILGRLFAEQLSSKPLSLLDEEALATPLNHQVAGLPAALLARALNFGGTCFTLDAACASSLYAFKLAMDELLSGRADLMLAGGLSRPDSLYTQMGFSQLRALSSTGTCSPFDRRGDGLVVGEGCGLLLLKRTRDALRDGDHIHAVIRGIGLSNDLQGNLLAPSSEGQLRAMRSAYRQAGWKPADVDLIECHATGTPVGDAVEFASLQRLWGETGWRSGQCVIGSVKANIGHLLTAAGAAATIKALLSLQHKILPSMPNFQEPAEGIRLEESPFKILQHPGEWQARKGGEPRRAAVSAFGFGGINAHMLLEEWLPQQAGRKKVTLHPVFTQKQQPIAVVGMGAEYGSWGDLEALQQRVFGGFSEAEPDVPQTWWGGSRSPFVEAQFAQGLPRGYFVPQVGSPAGQFRIPPTELAEMLPRQLLMLQVAAAALKDAGATTDDHLFTGVFIGCGLDPGATTFSFRWGLARQAKLWAEELGLTLDDDQLRRWTAALREAAGPPLTANRTMGALGSVVASRIAREFRVGGPCFTLSSEENSSLRALEVAVHALQEGSINRALVGAVDLAGDLRTVICRRQLDVLTHGQADADVSGLILGEGAGALVLKRLEDARQDGDRIHAVITGIATAMGGRPVSRYPGAEVYGRAVEGACRSAGVDVSGISYIESAHNDPHSARTEIDAFTAFARPAGTQTSTPFSPVWTGRVTGDIGAAGQATGMAALIKTILCLRRQLLPPLRQSTLLPAATLPGFQAPAALQNWLVNHDRSPRRALVTAMGDEGSASAAVLEEFQQPRRKATILRPTGSLGAGLFALYGETPAAWLVHCRQLRQLAQDTSLSVDSLAARWYQLGQKDHEQGPCLTIVAGGTDELQDLLAVATDWLQQCSQAVPGHEPPLPPTVRERIFFSSSPLAAQGRVAFVFPGSGNHFAGMGRDLLCHWPALLAGQEQNSAFLADQYLPQLFWQDELPEALYADHNALVISHVALCTALHDLLRGFGIHPQMVSGYSLGESSGLFATGAWRDRDGMLQRLAESTLFTRELAGECRAARRVWQLPAGQDVDWILGIVNVSADRVRQALAGEKQVYLLIINTYKECVIGGQRQRVEAVVNRLQCHFIPLRGVTTVHCEVTRAVADAYRNLHLFEVTPPKGIDFYSCAMARKYPLTSSNAADAILAQALDTIDYPRVVEQLYRDGARIFLEVGPGASCSRMISSVLDDRPHLARSFCSPGSSALTQLLRLLAQCLAEGLPVDLEPLYGSVNIPEVSESAPPSKIYTTIGGTGFHPPLPEFVAPVPEVKRNGSLPTVGTPTADDHDRSSSPVVAGFLAAANEASAAHAAYLDCAASMEKSLAQMIAFQFELLEQGAEPPPVTHKQLGRTCPLPAPAEPPVQSVQHREAAVVFDRRQCLEFAVGSVAAMLGGDFAEVDSFPTRVRLPDEPLMLVDRIVALEGEPRSMSRGRVVTEHDVTADRWYLDGGRIPTCVAVEAGQADLFLSAYLGIDFITRGKAVYRLLDAVVTFHRGLPVVGDTIRYDIHIEKFFRQDQTYLFRFHFESTVNGEPLLSMRNGCAGFFTEAELAAGRGIVHTRLDQRPQPGKLPDDWRELAPMKVESYSDEQITALYAGDLESCFGEGFAALPLKNPYTLPGGHLKLVDRVVKLDPGGGRYGLGQITAEMDIEPDAWFLTCHFVDDQVMPGTLMYECCLHTLRIFLLRMGWIGEQGETWCEPVAGVDSGLKCRGQVTARTRKVSYQVSIRELGYRPEPFAIVDALMFADDHPIVEIPAMSVQLSGLSRRQVESLWRDRPQKIAQGRQVLFDTERITAFAIGKPSEAFGEPYRVFDQQRKIARLPGPPFQFLDRIVAIDGEPWKLVEGVTIEAEYDVPPDAWYFAAGRQPHMPFSVLLEVGLQPCGWLAAYLGSALTSDIDLSFRNLDGDAVQHRPVTKDSGTLTTRVEITRIASSGGMIIQGYSFAVSDDLGPVYTGTTVFGFFSRAALAQQVGVRGATPYAVPPDEGRRGRSFAYPAHAPYPEKKLRMVDDIEVFVPDGGPQNLGFIRGSKQVDPADWFFQAHFYQDPVWPGSLGLESFLQLLKVVAAERWGAAADTVFETVACGQEHRWNYRGQIIPTNSRVMVEAVVTAVDDEQKILWADGLLSVDDKVIYQMHQFALRLHA